jgi:hypothetical protein
MIPINLMITISNCCLACIMDLSLAREMSRILPSSSQEDPKFVKDQQAIGLGWLPADPDSRGTRYVSKVGLRLVERHGWLGRVWNPKNRPIVLLPEP